MTRIASNAPPLVPAADAPSPVELPPPTEEEKALLARIDRILAGQEPPPLLPPPQEVETVLNQLFAKAEHVSPEDRRRTAEDLTLQFYHGGKEVLTWQTPHGRAILAVGTPEVARVVRHLSPELRLQVLSQFVDPW